MAFNLLNVLFISITFDCIYFKTMLLGEQSFIICHLHILCCTSVWNMAYSST